MHLALMKEQQRASKRKAYGTKKYAGDKLALKAAKARGQNSTSNQKKQILSCHNNISAELSSLHSPPAINAKFHLPNAVQSSANILSIRDGIIGYESPLISNINLDITGSDRVLISGDNGTGKTAFLKAVMAHRELRIVGEWSTPSTERIGYIDQHYSHLDHQKTVIALAELASPGCTHAQLRSHLNDFLFHNNEQINQQVGSLSGGEKARVSLALLALQPRKLLLLDEITNNIDLETKNHLVQVLQGYPGAMIIISHDRRFMEGVYITHKYSIRKGNLFNEL